MPTLTVERQWRLLCAERLYRGVVEGWQVCPRVRAKPEVCRISYLKATRARTDRGWSGVGKEVLMVLATRKCFTAAGSPETRPPHNLREGRRAQDWRQQPNERGRLRALAHGQVHKAAWAGSGDRPGSRGRGKGKEARQGRLWAALQPAKVGAELRSLLKRTRPCLRGADE